MAELEIAWHKLPDLTELIRKGQGGDRFAANSFFSFAYPQLRRIAARVMPRAFKGDPMSSTDLLHEAYAERLSRWKGHVQDRNHYLAVATIAIRDQLIDRARRAKALKRDSASALALFPNQMATELSLEQILTLDRLIEEMKIADPQAAAVVRLRFYAGCSWEETAAAVGATVKIVRNDWGFAEEWLRERLTRR